MRLGVPGRIVLLASLTLATLARAGPADGTARLLAPPPGQQGGRAVYDAARTRVLLFGGSPLYSGEVFELPLAGPRIWRRLAVSGPPPAARMWFSMIVDPVRDRLIGFGGATAGGTYVNDLWQLSLAGTPTWSALAPTGGGPTARQEHTAIYDPVRDRMIVFGGGRGFGVGDSADVWALSLSDPPAWQRIVPSGSITARSGHTAIYDPDGDRMIVYGGRAGYSTVYGDLRALSLGGSPTWSLLTAVTAHPQARFGHAAAWDPTHKQMIISAGGNSLRLNDVWSLALSPTVAWTNLPGLSISTAGHYSVYDPLSDGVIVGDGYDQYGWESAAFELSLASPTSWTVQHFEPFGGDEPGFALDSVHNRALLFEGSGAWALSMEAEPQWTPILLAAPNPKPLTWRAMFHDPVRNRMIIVAETAVWSLDLANPTVWTTLATTGAPPSWSGQAAVYDPVRDRALVYDGSAAKGIWQLSLAGAPAWSPLAVGGSAPLDRSEPALAYEPVHDRLIMLGGMNASDVWQVPLAGAPAWSPIVTSGTGPTALGIAVCVLDALRHRLVVFGTGTAGFWSLPLEGDPVWSTLSPQGDVSFSRIPYQGAVFDAGHDRIVTYGGANGTDLEQSFELAFSGILDAPRPSPASTRLTFSRIAPDPASGEQSFEWSRPAGAGASLSILDVTGKRVWSHTLGSGETRAMWSGVAANGRAAAPGVYFAHLVTADGVARRRFVRLR